MVLLFSAFVVGASPPVSEWPCDPPPRPIVDVGSVETYSRRVQVLDTFYARCFGRVIGSDAPVTYMASSDGHLRREGDRARDSHEVEVNLYVSYRAQGYAAFTLTYPTPKPNGDWCSFAIPAWSEAELDRRAQECYDAMRRERSAAERNPRH